MTYLLDTHAWLWAVLDHPRLSRRARASLQALPAQEPAGIAAISLKEASWHLARGRVQVDEGFGPWQLWLRRAATQVEVVPLTADIAIESEELDNSISPDPADRLIAATARFHELVLVTSDDRMRRSSQVETLW